jgi:hypothetical protein
MRDIFTWKIIKFSKHIEMCSSLNGSIYFIVNYNFILLKHLHLTPFTCDKRLVKFLCSDIKFSITQSFFTVNKLTLRKSRGPLWTLFDTTIGWFQKFLTKIKTLIWIEWIFVLNFFNTQIIHSTQLGTIIITLKC